MELREGYLLAHAKGHAKASRSAIFVMRKWNASDHQSGSYKDRLLAVVGSAPIEVRIDFNFWPEEPPYSNGRQTILRCAVPGDGICPRPFAFETGREPPAVVVSAS
jgi:hypothetical protein